ncbi:MAG: peroxiredoxin [Thermoanaerobaculia bacterium]|nr:peroxiredoxin [Thermoanaerobaculia bacterium]
MTIQVGDKLPSGTLRKFDGAIQTVATDDLFGGRTVVLFAVPGAFTPTCNDTHFPGFQVSTDKLKERGVDQVVCIAVNDPFVMAAWDKALGARDIEMLSDGNGDYVAQLGLTLDLSAIGLGTRSARFALVVEDGVVRYLGVEPGKDVGVSSADAVLAHLDH